MSQPSLLEGFHGHAHAHAHGGHYGVSLENMVHSGLAFAQARPPMRAPVLAPAGFNQQHTGQHQQRLSHQHPHPHPHQHPHQHPLHQGRPRPAHFTSSQQQHPHPHQHRMADAGYISPEELAHLQKLSSEYEPEVTGPLVGERQSSAAITTEYANADPVFRIKTAALPAKYAFFRTCRGDGHCGWRAIAFTYFEALLRVANAQKLDEEIARLTSMANLFEQVGYPFDVWIDFADEAFDLMRKLAASLRSMDGAHEDILLAKFNDQHESMAIITYVKFLASAWIQTHAEDYMAFVSMGDVKSYCSNNIEPTQCEADNIAIVALAEALVKPAGFGLEVWYLDRSPGEEINRSYFAEPADRNGTPMPNAPMLRLLYRPGHYDILYKTGDVPQPVQHQPIPAQPPLQVHLANHFDEFVPAAANVSDVITMIPGMSGGFPSSMGQRWPSLYDFSPSPAPQAHVTPVQSYSTVQTPATPVGSAHMDFGVAAHSTHTSQYSAPSHHSISLDQPPVTLPIHPAPQPSINMERSTPLVVERGGPFRPSMYELEPGFGNTMQTQPFQTSIFRNSHFNTAHFLNQDFQPEQWSPDDEYATGNRGRHKSHSS